MTTTATLPLKGPLTIRTVAETHAALIAFLNENGGAGRTLTLDIDDASECDLTLPQLLISARKTAAQSDTKIQLKSPATGNFLTVIGRAGLLTGDKEQDGFWLEGKAA